MYKCIHYKREINMSINLHFKCEINVWQELIVQYKDYGTTRHKDIF